VAQRGGGTVRLARGDYVSGTIDLRSDVALEVTKDARLLASLDLKDYPERVAKRRTVQDTNMGMNQSLIFAEGCRNIALRGAGLIDGRGSKRNFPGAETSGTTPGRPFLIRVLDCQSVYVADLQLKDSPCWMQNYLNCEDLLIERLHVENQANFNNDGLDIDGCRRVIVRDCFINSEDDALCFKGASQRPTADVLVENCRLYSSCNALKFGTDSQGDFRRVLARNLEVGGPAREMRSLHRRRADSGISWEVVDGGTAEELLATRVRIVRAKSPLFLRLGDRGRVRPEDPRPPPGTLRRIVFDQITGSENGPRGSYFIGIPDKRIEDVAIRDLRLEMSAADTAIPDPKAIPEMRGDYPDAHMIAGITPAYGLWTRHVAGLSLVRVTFVPGSRDPRPAIETTADTSGVCIG
jgi:polygalacturonase